MSLGKRSSDTDGGNNISRMTRSRLSNNEESSQEISAQGPNSISSGKEKNSFIDFEKVKFQSNEKEENKFENLSQDNQEHCVHSIIRLFLFKGLRKEVINRTLIAEALAEIDPEFKKHINAVLNRAQRYAYSNLGMIILSAIHVPQANDHRRDEYYISNTISNSTVSKYLLSSHPNKAYLGFMLFIFHAILNAPGQQATCNDLLSKLRKLDPRFPQTLSTHKSGVTSLPVPELEDDFLGLLNKMKKERYINSEKDEKYPDDISKSIYTFGTRFYLEIGKVELLKSYFRMAGQPIDEYALKEMEE